MPKDNKIYLEHILDSVNNILLFTEGLSKEEFLENKMIQHASIRNLEVIGEAAKNLSSDFKEKYPEIEWKKMAGMRDKLIHSYMSVDIWATWEVITKILTPLKLKIIEILNNNACCEK
jgi:uncharacterized protein with HEPN domain